MAQETYRVDCRDELIKAFKYATRLMEKAKLGIIVTISEKKQKRSSKQNRYYRGGLVAKIADNSGFSKHEYESVHEALKEMFCPSKKTVFGIEVKSTTLLDTAEMEQYHKDIRDWYWDFAHYLLPEPNEIPNNEGE